MISSQTLNKTALNEISKKYSGRLVDFHGWQLPIQYEGILKEHEAVRNSVGIFDVSHMGQIFLTGSDAFKLIQKTNTNDLIFPIPELVSFVSHVMTLLPGDVIATGTTSGIGPMQPGDTVEVIIEPIGTLRNYVIRL